MTIRAYIDALKESVEAALAALDFEPRGDRRQLPRHAAADAASSAIPIIAIAGRPRGCSREALGRELIVAFQSRFGRAKWLEPATDADARRRCPGRA